MDLLLHAGDEYQRMLWIDVVVKRYGVGKTESAAASVSDGGSRSGERAV